MRRFLAVLMCVLTSAISFSQTGHIPANEDLLLKEENEASKPGKVDTIPDDPIGISRAKDATGVRADSTAEGIKSRCVMVGATGQMFGLSGRLVQFENPGFSVLIPFQSDSKSEKDLTIEAGMFHHEKVTNSAFLGINRTFKSFKHGEQFMLDVSWGGGYMHSWYPGELYSQTPEGDLVRKRQIGRPHLYGSAGLLGKWAFGEAVALTWRQQVLLQTPFANGIPVMLHRLMTIGIQLQFPQD
ncbi:hypothetical protein OAW57_01895 [Flavobacteriales bacterium]|nr:hypothetical protein [Flavobacteriales bacterium]